MIALARFAIAGLLRAPLRAFVRVLVLAASSALLGAMVLFVGHSLHTMTASAVQSVPLDWQGPVTTAAAAKRVAPGVAQQPGIQEAVPVATAPFAGTSHTAAVGTIRAGAGALLAVPPGYTSHIQTFRFLRGSMKPGAIVLDQQLAATLQAQPGDTISLMPRQGVKPLRLPVSGIAIVTAPDVLFQPLNPLSGPAPAQPPANVAVLPLATFERRVAPLLRSVGAATPSAAAVPGTLAGTQWQVQVQVDPRALTGSPAHALGAATHLRNRVERSLPGQVQFVDNLADGLNSAAGDALYAETLYILLAVPGALVALGLAYLAALGTVDRDRRDLALLRARGAARRVPHAVGLSGALIGATFGVCVAIAFVGAFVARMAASVVAFRGAVAEARTGAKRPRTPLWQRLYVDVAALVVSGLVYWLTARNGFSAVVSPDSNPTLSLSVYMFLAPALLWLGVALLLVRLRGSVFAWLTARAAGKRASTLRGFLLASASRRAAAVNRGLLLVGLLLAFGVELGIFSATYDQQVRIDAQLTLGADVVATAPPGVISSHGLERRVARLPGVAATTPVDHTYAYVGPDLQDTFGIDTPTVGKATGLRDSYFLGGTAAQTIGRLQRTRDGILVSKETITDYSLGVGDLLKLRVLDKNTGRFHVALFHVVGIVQEFPSAPRDSFMVANRPYLQSVTHDPGPNVLFIKANGDPITVAHRVAAATRQDGAIVKNIRQQTAQTVSSITTVDLSGISRIEEAFAIGLAAAAMILLVAVGMAERRQELATMAAVGASTREVAAFLWTEVALVLVAGLALAAFLGWLLAEMLVALLQHVFDPPPDHLAAPWLFLGSLAGATVVGALLAAFAARRGIARLPLGAILREE
ncbi:MAG: ABC transporter permease [Actinobacteria bacterium]|nr:MAG: ABC transporter permease [Actinomycetota bacterium]